jgi:hypothetical protein
MPASAAASSTASASESSTSPQSAPSCHVPRPMTETALPVLPRIRCSTRSDPNGRGMTATLAVNCHYVRPEATCPYVRIQAR